MALRPAVRILGSLELDGADGPIRVGASKQRALLALLVIRAGTPVHRDVLVDSLWDGTEPDSAVNAVQNYVLRLRRALAEVGGLEILTEPQGYRLTVQAGVLDAAVAAELIERGRSAAGAGELERARPLLLSALELWRGPSLMEFADRDFAAAEAARLDELRQSTEEELVDIELALGRPRRAVSMLERMVTTQPLREHRWEQWMLGLYRVGRQADALDAFRRVSKILSEELGVDPGPALLQLRDQILRHDPTLEVAGPSAGDRSPASKPPAAPAFFGRSEEFAVLAERYKSAASGTGGLIVVVGEPGIGKTSLLRRFIDSARAKGALVISGRCLDGGWVPPYHPFAEIIEKWISTTKPDDLLGEIATTVEALGPLVPRVHGLAGHGPRDRLGPDEERLRLLDGFARFLITLARHRPVVVVVDDLHWADASTALMLRHAARSATGQRVLLVGAYRSGEAPALLIDTLGAMRTETDLRTLRLRGLPKADMRDLLSARARIPLSEELVVEITSETGGNPFFAREVIQHLIEEGAVQPDAEGKLVRYGTGDLVPEGVRQVLARRRGRLAEDANRLLDAASGFEGPFRFGIVSTVSGLNETAALAAIDQVMAAGLVEPDATPERYQFQHALIRHAVSAELNPSRRLRLHRRLAEALAEARAHDPDGVAAAEVAAQYYASAALPGADAGVAAAVEAADEAEAATAHTEAAAFLEMACEMLPGGDQRLLPLRARLGLELAWAQRFDEAVTVAGSAAEALAAGEGADRASSYLADVTAALTAADSAPHAWPLAVQGLRFIGDRRDRAWALLTLHDLDRRDAEDPDFPGIVLDDPRRRQALRVVLDTGGVGDRVDLARFAAAAVYGRRDLIPAESAQDPTVRLFLLGDYAGALPVLEERARAAHRLGQLALEGYCRGSVARCHIALGNFELGQAGLAEERRIAARIGRGLWGWQRLQLTGTLDALAHGLDSGWEGLLEQITGVFGPSNPASRRLEATAAAGAAKAAAHLGHEDDARQWLELTLPAIEQAPAWAMNFLRVLCDAVETVWLLRGHPSQRRLEDAVRTKALAADFRFPMMDARLALARLCALDGRSDEAQTWFAAARGALDEEGSRPLRAIVDFDEAEMLRQVGALDAARELHTAALRQFEALGMIGWVTRARQVVVRSHERG